MLVQGRDFTTMDVFLTKEAAECLDTRGAASFKVHDLLSKMYFEDIWNSAVIREKLNVFANALFVCKNEKEQDYFYQMLFDIISFYNMGNANQLFQSSQGTWRTWDKLSGEKCRNNQFLSAIYYLNYFFEFLSNMQLEDDELYQELRHVLFLNLTLFLKHFTTQEEFEQSIRQISNQIDVIATFYDYTEEIEQSFINSVLMSKNEFIYFLKEEANCILELTEEERALYYRYVKLVSTIIEYCELYASRQSIYGIIETDIQDILQNKNIVS